MMDLLREWFSSWGQSAYCRKEFPQHWSSFVDAFCDTVHARGLAAVPPPHARANLKAASMSAPASSSSSSSTLPSAPPPLPLPPPSVLPPAPNRLVAIGDLHGDLDKARRALVAARVLDPRTDRWCGGDAVVVQVGDVLDRGDGEVACLFLLERLAREAELAGGAVHVLNGNHETMNVGGRYRYATPGGLADFLRFELVEAVGEQLREKCGCFVSSSPSRSGNDAIATKSNGRSIKGPAHALHSLAGGPAALEEAALAARARALAPGTGEITRRFLADKRVVLQVGSTVFVHGGLLPSHLVSSSSDGGDGDASSALDRLNAEAAAWMRGEAEPFSISSSTLSSSTSAAAASPPRPMQMPEFLRGRDAVVWSRSFSPEDARKADCELLRETLAKLSGGNEAKRMVMGHTIQEKGVNAACGGRALRVDVGLSAGCGDGRVEVLEILADGAVPGSVRRLVEVEEKSVVVGSREAKRTSRVAAVPGVAAALGGGGGLPSLGEVDDEGVSDDDERSRWRIWSWWKGNGGGGRATPSPPEPTPTSVSAAA